MSLYERFSRGCVVWGQAPALRNEVDLEHAQVIAALRYGYPVRLNLQLETDPDSRLSISRDVFGGKVHVSSWKSRWLEDIFNHSRDVKIEYVNLSPTREAKVSRRLCGWMNEFGVRSYSSGQLPELPAPFSQGRRVFHWDGVTKLFDGGNNLLCQMPFKVGFRIAAEHALTGCSV